MCVLLPFVNPDEKFSPLPVSAKAMLEARNNLLEGRGQGEQSHQNSISLIFLLLTELVSPWEGCCVLRLDTISQGSQ